MMQRKLYSFFLIVALLIAGCTESRQLLDQVKSEIEERFSRVEGDFALVFKSLDDTTRQIHINEREMFHAASTIKALVMIEIFR